MKRWLALLLLALSACSNEKAAAPASNGARSAEIAGPSIYPLVVTLRDARGTSIGLDVFRGHPVVISMFYGSCPVACPLIVSHVKEIEAQLPQGARDDLRVLLVSFDPAHDTPAVLAGIAASRGLDASRWTLATGSDDVVREIAAVLGVSYRALPEGGFAHDSVLTVLDKDGRVLARTDDAQPDLGPLRAAIVKSGGPT
jgi:protein SCO1